MELNQNSADIQRQLIGILSFPSLEPETYDQFFRGISKVAISDYPLHHACLSFRPSVCPRGTTRIPLDGFSWYFIFEYILLKNSSVIKIRQE
jgi:hypothetical protein